MTETIELADLLNGFFEYDETVWFDKVNDTEGDNSHPGTKWTARRGNKIEQAIKLAHERLNSMALYTEGSDRTLKNSRFEFLLLKASVTSGLTSNIFVDNFETLEGITLTSGAHDAELQRIYLP